jgi:hypothetical protein
MPLTWILTEIESEVRELVGMPGTSGLDTSAMQNRINDFYVNWFPAYVYAQELESWWTFDTADSDTGSTETLPATVYTIDEPMTIKDSDGNVSKINFYINKNEFYELYPEDSHDEEDERGTPKAALLYNRTVDLRPKADEVFTFKAASKIKPTALGVGDAPLRIEWGPAIAQGTAVMIKNRGKDMEAALELDEGFQGFITIINRRDLIQKHKGKRAMPRF